MSASVYYYVWPAVTALGGRESHIKITDDSPGITTGELVPALYGQPAPALDARSARRSPDQQAAAIQRTIHVSLFREVLTDI